MRTVSVLLGSLFSFLSLQALVFNAGFYSAVLKPDSSTGTVEAFLRNEKRRKVENRNQVLAVGDSRNGFFPRYANELRPEIGYTFATISVAGTTPRCWYYMLREVDPTTRRYAAIIIPVEDYDDGEVWEDYANREADLHFVVSLLRLGDLLGFSRSFHDASRRWEVFRGALFKGLVYKQDFQDFLLHPIARVEFVNLSRTGSSDWFYDYVGPTRNMKGLGVDWSTGRITVPPGTTPEQKLEYERHFLPPLPPQRGRRSAYLRSWFEKIYERYRGSGTRLVFIRLPRGPIVRPDQPPFNPHSSVRELAMRPGVILSPEHCFDSLERPELFMDQVHLNGPGEAEYSRMLGREVRRLLGPPR